MSGLLSKLGRKHVGTTRVNTNLSASVVSTLRVVNNSRRRFHG